MPDFDELQRAFFDGLYTNRIPALFGSIVVAVVVAVIAWRLGWFAAARRHPVRAGVLAAILLAVALPFGYYTASPLWVRTELVEPDPVAAIATATSIPTAASEATPAPSTPAAPAPSVAPATPAPTALVARKVTLGSFTGTDDFHFGKGTASIIETAPGAYHLRLDDFSVRNGPDLYVYLSPEDDYAKGALEVGKLKATDGAFGYDLPAGTDPADFASAIIWCKQFSHLFAVAPFESV